MPMNDIHFGCRTEEEEGPVSVELIVTRPARAISLSEWTRLIGEDDDLRLRAEPYVATNPTSGARISIKTGQAEAEIEVNGQWIPFLRNQTAGSRPNTLKSLMTRRMLSASRWRPLQSALGP